MQFFYENKDSFLQRSINTCLTVPAHFHQRVEFVYMIEGSSKVCIDSKEYTISAGDILVIFPNQIHEYKKISEEKSILLVFSPDICSEYKNELLSYVPKSSIIRSSSRNAELLPLLHDILSCNDKSSKYSSIILKGYFLILLGKLLPMLDLVPVDSSGADTMRAIVSYCSANYMKDIHLEDLESALHISKYHISHLFSRKLNLSFNEYINMLRISDACSMLKSGDKKITDIAFATGFNSSRSFNRVFLKITGMTPGEFRAS